MSKVVCDISISADGYSAGHNQTEERPFGHGDTSMLHSWMFDTPDENQAELEAMKSAKAFIMGRNMFGSVRGEWSGDWRGSWGPEPPFHAPVFVLTHYGREPLAVDGGTMFHFVTDDIETTVRELRARGVVFEEYDLPGLKTVDGIADIEGIYPSKGTGERAAWFHDSEGNVLGVGQPIRR